MIRVRELAAVACSSLLLLKSGQATSAAAAASTTTTTTGPSNGGYTNNGGSLGGRLNKLGTDGRSSAWASRKSATSTATATAPPPTSPSSALLLSLLRGGFDVNPELGRYSWIPAGEGDGGSLVRLSDSGEVVAGEVPGGGGGEDGSGRVVMASVTAAAAAVLARVGVGRGGNPEAAAAAKDKAAKDATAAAAAAPRAGVAAAAAAATRSVAPAKSGGKKADAKRAVREKKEAAARALKGKKAAAAEQALREKAAAAEKAAREKKGASSKAVAAVAQPAAAAVQSVAGVGVSARWPMFSAFLYFLAMAFTIPVLPKVVNEMVTGSKAVTAASATLYGLLSSTDASFTLMTVKFHASMSDKYGRRPFLALSALGLGLGFFITYHSKRVWMLLLASAIDGCTSCMYSMAQACITDCVGTGPGLGEAFGVFQGLSLGMAFMIGLPLGGVLGAKRGVRFPLLVSVCLCAVNLFMIAFVMPETLPQEKRVKQVQMKQANPLGAVTMATRNNLITGVIACWTLLWIAHVGLQINWINYTDRKFGWGVAQSGASLALMGLLVAVFPKLIIPRLGLERSITTGLLIYTVGQLVIASAPGVTNDLSRYGTPMAVSGLVLASAGTIVFPSMLAYLCNQVGGGEVGALQGTTDTAKTICSVVFGPAMAWIFGYFISDNAYPRKIEGASYYVGAAVAALAYLTAQRTFSVHGSLDRVPPSARTKR